MEEVRAALASDAVPESARPWVEAVTNGVIAPLQARVESAETDFNVARDTFLELAQQLEAAGAEGSDLLAARVTEDMEVLEKMTQDMSNLSWQAFHAMNPEYAGLPTDSPIHKSFEEVVGNIFAMFPDGTLVDKLNNAYRFAAYRSNTDLAAIKGTPQKVAQPVAAPTPPPAPAAPTEDAHPQSSAQAFVNDGRVAPTPPYTSLDDISGQELLDRYDHML